MAALSGQSKCQWGPGARLQVPALSTHALGNPSEPPPQEAELCLPLLFGEAGAAAFTGLGACFQNRPEADVTPFPALSLLYESPSSVAPTFVPGLPDLSLVAHWSEGRRTLEWVSVPGRYSGPWGSSCFALKLPRVGASLVVQWLRLAFQGRECRFRSWSGDGIPHASAKKNPKHSPEAVL